MCIELLHLPREEETQMQISEQTWRIINLAVPTVVAIVAIVVGARTLNSAFRRTESTIEGGFSQTHSTLGTLEENSLILALGTKGDRPNWPNFLRKAKEKAIDGGYIRIAIRGFISTGEGERKLTAEIQTQIQEIVERNPNLSFEEMSAKVIEELGIRRISALTRAGRVSLNEMIAIVAGFAERIRTKE
jgi:hypothetical protein